MRPPVLALLTLLALSLPASLVAQAPGISRADRQDDRPPPPGVGGDSTIPAGYKGVVWGINPTAIQAIKGARVLMKLGHSVTTDHISPAGVIPPEGPAAKFLESQGVSRTNFNSFGSRRGNDRVMTRGTFANIRIKNELAPGTEGGYTTYLGPGETPSGPFPWLTYDSEVSPDTGDVVDVFDASVKYQQHRIPLVVLAAFWVGYQRHAGEGLEEMLKAWILPNSVMAGLLTACAGAKILSILAAIISSPITSLNPLPGAGMVVGLLEAWLRRPTVEDAERINEDVQSLKGMYRNPFTRVLLVAVFSTLGSAMGAWIGIGWLLTLLGA